MNTAKTTLHVFAFSLCCVGITQAAVVPVENFDFESPAQAEGAMNSGPVVGWMESTTIGAIIGNYNPNTTHYSDTDILTANGGEVGDMNGPNVLFMSGAFTGFSQASVTQELVPAMIPGETYTITVAVGTRSGGGAFAGYFIEILSDGNFVSGLTSFQSPGPAGTFTDVSVSHIAQPGENGVLSVRLSNGSSGDYVDFDNVRLERGVVNGRGASIDFDGNWASSSNALIPVNNFDFGDPQLGEGAVNGSTVNEWTTSGIVDSIRGTYNPDATSYSNPDILDVNGGVIGDMDDIHVMALFHLAGFTGAHQASAEQTLGVPIVPGETYTLNVSVGTRDVPPLAFAGYHIALLAGATQLTSISSSASPGAGTFKTVSLRYTAQPGDAGLLGVRLSNAGPGNYVDFDNVRLYSEISETESQFQTQVGFHRFNNGQIGDSLPLIDGTTANFETSFQNFLDVFGSGQHMGVTVRTSPSGQGRNHDHGILQGPMTGSFKARSDLLRDLYHLGGTDGSTDTFVLELDLPSQGNYAFHSYHHWMANDGLEGVAAVKVNGVMEGAVFQSSGTDPDEIATFTHCFTLGGPDTVTIEYTQSGDKRFGINGFKIGKVKDCASDDYDEDGLKNSWETDGLTCGGGTVDLPRMGADPLRKDIFLEIDYMKSALVSHEPKPDAMQLIMESFNRAPVKNPDGVNGITIHIDSGENAVMNPVFNADGLLNTSESSTWGTLTDADQLAYVDPLGTFTPSASPSYSWAAFDALKNTNFLNWREPTFRYCISARSFNPKMNSGNARTTPGSDYIVALPTGGSVSEQAGTFMHELGHCLGLEHAGTVRNGNFAPNHLSIMNYSFQMPGLRFNGADGRLDYSRFVLGALDEHALNEDEGIKFPYVAESVGYGTYYYNSNGTKIPADDVRGPIDWDDNGIIGGVVNADINATEASKGSGNCSLEPNPCRNGCFDVPSNPCAMIGGTCDTRSCIESSTDWNILVYDGGLIGTCPSLGLRGSLPMFNEPDSITIAEANSLEVELRVAVKAPGAARIAASGAGSLDYMITNTGQLADTYSIDATAVQTWADTNSVPSSVLLNPGQSTSFSIPVNVPPGEAVHTSDAVEVRITSMSNPLVFDTPKSTIVVGPAVFGDDDGNGSVTLGDYGFFHDCLAGPGLSPNPAQSTIDECRTIFDDNLDYDVDLEDYAELQRVFTP